MSNDKLEALKAVAADSMAEEIVWKQCNHLSHAEIRRLLPGWDPSEGTDQDHKFQETFNPKLILKLLEAYEGIEAFATALTNAGAMSDEYNPTLYQIQAQAKSAIARAEAALEEGK